MGLNRLTVPLIFPDDNFAPAAITDIYSTNDTSQNTIIPIVLKQVQQCEAITKN